MMFSVILNKIEKRKLKRAQFIAWTLFFVLGVGYFAATLWLTLN